MEMEKSVNWEYIDRSHWACESEMFVVKGGLGYPGQGNDVIKDIGIRTRLGGALLRFYSVPFTLHLGEANLLDSPINRQKLCNN